MHDMSEFLREHGKAVCKPLDGMGGKSIFVLEQGDKNRNVVFETLTDYGTRYAIVQRYLPGIVDRRRLPGHPGGRRARALRPEAHSHCPRTTAAISPPARAPRAGRSTSATDGCARKSDPSSRRPE